MEEPSNQPITREYACVYPRCSNKSKSRDDWFRHDSSQHFQIEMWVCLHKTATGQRCLDLSYNTQCFEQHLQTHEGTVPSEDIKSSRIGRNGQFQYWCGFCAQLQKLETVRSEAWHERAGHILDHFNKGCTPSDWWCLESKGYKGEVKQNNS